MRSRHVCRSTGQVIPSAKLVPDDINLTRQECKDTLRINNPCERCSEVQLAFSLSFHWLLYLSSFYLSFPLSCSTITRIIDISLSGNTSSTGFWTAEKPPPERKWFMCTARKIRRCVYLLPMNLHSLDTGKHSSVFFHPQKPKDPLGFCEEKPFRQLARNSEPTLLGLFLFLFLFYFLPFFFPFSYSLSHSLSWCEANTPEHSLADPQKTAVHRSSYVLLYHQGRVCVAGFSFAQMDCGYL